MKLNKVEKYLCRKAYLHTELYSKSDPNFYKAGGRAGAYRKLARLVINKWQDKPVELLMMFSKEGYEVTGNF